MKGPKSNQQSTPKSKKSQSNDTSTQHTDQSTMSAQNQTPTPELQEAQAKINELTKISQQALADLQNYKKRAEEEKLQFARFANLQLISELLPLLDNFQLAIKHQPQNPSDKDWAQGIVSIIQQFQTILEKQGLTKIHPQNQPFNPNFHEAITTAPGPKDQVLEVAETGYQMGDKVIRRAKVIVGTDQ